MLRVVASLRLVQILSDFEVDKWIFPEKPKILSPKIKISSNLYVKRVRARSTYFLRISQKDRILEIASEP